MKTLTLMQSAWLIASVAASVPVQADLFTNAVGISIYSTEWARPGPKNTPKIGLPSYLRTNYFMGASTLPNGGNGAGFVLFVDSSDTDAPILRPSDEFTLIGIGHSWYSGVGTGMVIDADFVAAADPFYSSFAFNNVSGEVALTEGESFHMAFHLDDELIPTPHAPSKGDVYGWMELEYVGGELNLLRSAAQNDGTSIVVGQIPEPSSVLLLFLGGVGVALFRHFFVPG